MPARSGRGAELSEVTSGEDAPAAPAEATVTLELTLPPSDLARLLRSPALAALRVGRARTAQASIVWHDTGEGELASQGLALSQGANATARALWRLERLRPNGEGDWLPGCPAPVLAEDLALGALGHAIAGPLQPLAAFHGRRCSYTLAGAALTVLAGTLRGVAQDRPVCRLLLQGEAGVVTDLAARLGDAVRIGVPRAGFAAEALAVATGRPAVARHTGAPAASPAMSVADALGMAVAHLADVVLYWAAEVPGADGPEPVHQMRVALRRLRSALAVFRRAAQAAPETAGGEAPWLDALDARLRSLAASFGAARDWDVFLAETGADVASAFGRDRRIARMLAAARRRRTEAYTMLAHTLGGRSWARLELDLALLPTRQPWFDHALPDRAAWLASPVQPFAADALSRLLKRVVAPGKSVSHLPADELHALRKRAKRLRYAAEFFAPLFPAKQVRRYLSRLAELQEVLGTVNDTAMAAGLMEQLGGGADRAFASGVVQGYGAARGARAMERVARAWSRFYRAAPFWD